MSLWGIISTLYIEPVPTSSWAWIKSSGLVHRTCLPVTSCTIWDYLLNLSGSWVSYLQLTEQNMFQNDVVFINFKMCFYILVSTNFVGYKYSISNTACFYPKLCLLLSLSFILVFFPPENINGIILFTILLHSKPTLKHFSFHLSLPYWGSFWSSLRFHDTLLSWLSLACCPLFHFGYSST